MPRQFKAIAFDVDLPSLASLREALPGWKIEVLDGATVASLACVWDPGVVDLLVVGFRAGGAETLELCRFLASQKAPRGAKEPGVLAESLHHHARRTAASLLVLVPPGQETFIEAVLTAGAHSCLVQPIHAQDVARMLVHARAGNQPGRHTLNLERAQVEDAWQDEGGEG
jgi:hypothetical protein